jgi:hypothetical protein
VGVAFVQQRTPVFDAFGDSKFVTHVPDIDTVEHCISEGWEHTNGHSFGEKARVVLRMVDIDIEVLDASNELLQLLFDVEEETPKDISSGVDSIL